MRWNSHLSRLCPHCRALCSEQAGGGSPTHPPVCWHSVTLPVDATGSRDIDGEIDVLQSSGGALKSSGLSLLLISERHWNIAVENDLPMLRLGRPIFDVDPILPNSVAAEIPVTFDKVRTNGLGCVEESCLSLASRVQQVDDLKTRFHDCYDAIKGGTLVFLTIQ
jgi:hypothetical protein